MKKPKPQPNIAFVSKNHAPVREIFTEPKNIKLPANQSKPFHHKNADKIVRLFPYLYKKVISKS